jgi:CheY-like chemotaxis protein
MSGPSAARFDGARVLVVEDEPHLRRWVADLLEGHAHCVELAVDGLEAWSRVQREPRIDLVLTDLRMPNLDGFELLELLGKLPRETRPPTLVMTAIARPQERERALSLGAVAVMTKPLRALELLDAVRAELRAAPRV